MFFIELKPDLNNKRIYEIKTLLQCKISFEPPHSRREVSQCMNCQRYGHTKSFCYRKARCVKCAGEHSTDNCSRKERSNNVKCVLCGGNHSANYKGCTVYKDLQRITYPSLRKKELPTRTQDDLEPQSKEQTRKPLGHNILNPSNKTYAQAVQNSTSRQKKDHTETHTASQINDINELKSMMKEWTKWVLC